LSVCDTHYFEFITIVDVDGSVYTCTVHVSETVVIALFTSTPEVH